MPHGKQYDLPYPPETLGIADATETADRAEILPPGQAPSHSHAEDAHIAAAGATARSLLLPGGDQDASGGSTSAILLQQDHQRQHRQGQQDTQQGQQPQSGPSSHMMQANQHQPPQQQQQHECQQGVTHEHQQEQRQHQKQAICGSGSVQLGIASAAADLDQQVSGSAGQRSSAPSSPVRGRAGPASANQSSQTLWAPWADFDVHSVLEVACMKLLPNFLIDMARVGELALSCVCACMQCMHR